MMYTNEELLAISSAACSLSTYTNAALYTLDTFMEMYLENKDGINDLIERLKKILTESTLNYLPLNR